MMILLPRLRTTLKTDVQLQFRNGFYYAAIVMGLFWVLLLRWLPFDHFPRFLPFMVYTNLCISTYYFMAGIVLLEKAEGTHNAQVVTPLRPFEWLLSKVLSLSFLATLENIVIIGLAYGWHHINVAVIISTGFCAVLYALFGLISVLKYDSINTFLIPSLLFTAIINLPLLGYFELTSDLWFIWNPMHFAINTLHLAFNEGLNTLAFWGWSGLLFVSTLATFWCARVLYIRFIIQRAG